MKKTKILSFEPTVDVFTTFITLQEKGIVPRDTCSASLGHWEDKKDGKLYNDVEYDFKESCQFDDLSDFNQFFVEHTIKGFDKENIRIDAYFNLCMKEKVEYYVEFEPYDIYVLPETRKTLVDFHKKDPFIVNKIKEMFTQLNELGWKPKIFNPSVVISEK